MNLFKRITIIISMAAAAFGAASCEQDSTLRYGNFTMGNVVDGKFVSDQGNTFNVVEQLCPGKLDTMKRAIIICDVLKAAEGKNDEYDVRLRQMAKVLDKTPVAAADATEGDIAVCDPVHIAQVWISGGYINMEIHFETKVNSKKQHLINLVFNGKTVKEEGKTPAYSFTLRHNAFEDTLTENNKEDVFVVGAGYVSFPIMGIMEEEQAVIDLEWKSHIITDGAWSVETAENSYSIPYTKGEFQHVPPQVSTAAAVIME